MRNLKTPSRQLILSLLSGCAGLAVHMLTLSALVEWGRLDPRSATAIGYALAVIINYLLQYHIVFQSRAEHREAFVRYVALTAAGLGVNVLAMHVLTIMLGLWYLVAQLVSIGALFIVNFVVAAGKQWRNVADQLRAKLPKLAALLDEAEVDVLAFVSFPRERWDKISSTNPIERLNGEIKRRADVVGIFPNDDAIVRLVGAILMEQNDEWAEQRARDMTLETIAPSAIIPSSSCPPWPHDTPAPAGDRRWLHCYTTPRDTTLCGGRRREPPPATRWEGRRSMSYMQPRPSSTLQNRRRDRRIG
jgi:putative flippase GtrA